MINPDKFSSIKKCIEDYYIKNDKAPTVREIEAITKISRASVQRYLQIMRDNGEISYNGFRGVETGLMQKLKQDKSNLVGLVGSIICGEPAFAEENIEEYFRLPTSLFGQGEFYLLHAKGDSMIDAGIDSGDLVLIKKQSTAKSGDIIVALIDEETTLKRYFPEGF